jgi:HTH-type transcriptional regulator, glycine betaine synthesis regulator
MSDQSLSTARLDMIDAGGRICQLLGYPRSVGQIYGLLYLSIKPLTLDDIVELLGISKGNASLGIRQLASVGGIIQTWIPGDRKDYFTIQPDIIQVIRGALQTLVKPRLTSSGQRLDRMTDSLEADWKSGAITKEEYKLCSERLKQLTQIQNKIESLAPIVEKFL